MIILYDHVHPVGAFAKNAPIDVSDFNVIHFGYNVVTWPTT